MPNFQNDGVEIEANRNGTTVTFKVLRQSKKFTDILQFMKVIEDKQSKFSLRSNKMPAFSKKNYRFFLRGDDVGQNNKEVTIHFQLESTAKKAMEAFPRLINAVKMPDIVAEPEEINNVGVDLSSTTGVRWVFIKKEIAQALRLTDYNLYPQNYIQWRKTEPKPSNSQHHYERSAQIIHLLNKSIGADTDSNVINARKITRERANLAIAETRALIEKAYANGWHVELWRILGGIRSNDASHKVLKKADIRELMA